MNKEYPILDYGFIRIEDIKGSDAAIAKAARVSYGVTDERSDEENERLVRYLVEHYHDSPLEMAGIKLHVRSPIFVARQWFRHRMGHYNEYSGRYKEMKDLFYLPNPDRLRLQPKGNQQGSDLSLPKWKRWLSGAILGASTRLSYRMYRCLIGLGLANELSRTILPMNVYTEFYVDMDLRNLINFVRLRDSEHAQPEIREYAKVISSIIADNFPYTYGAFNEFRGSGTVNLSQGNLDLLQDVFDHGTSFTKQTAYDMAVNNTEYPKHLKGEFNRSKKKIKKLIGL